MLFGEHVEDDDLSVNKDCKSTWQHCPLGWSYRQSTSVEMYLTFQFCLSVTRLL